MRVLFITDGVYAPASRFRCEQFFDAFAKNGLSCTLKFGYGPEYNRIAFSKLGSLYKVLARARRGVAQVFDGDYDLKVLQRTAFPHFPYLEYLSGRFIFDFDDNLEVNGHGEVARLRKWTFETAVEQAYHLVPGNQFLARQAGRPEKTTIIPTVIDSDKYVPRNRNEGPIVIGWMGTAGNFGFLEKLVPSLRRVLARNPRVILRLVSNQTFESLAGHPQVEQIRWRPDTEVALLQSFDIGLMPLVQSPLTEGKCAFKMIQYMSVGRPVVVSRVGANIEVFGDGPDGPGFLEPEFEWDESLQSLIDDEKLRATMGEWGRERVVDSYSLHAAVPLYLSVFERVANS